MQSIQQITFSSHHCPNSVSLSHIPPCSIPQCPIHSAPVTNFPQNRIPRGDQGPETLPSLSSPLHIPQIGRNPAFWWAPFWAPRSSIGITALDGLLSSTITGPWSRKQQTLYLWQSHKVTRIASKPTKKELVEHSMR